MSNESKAARLRLRAKVCRDLATAAQTENERKRWQDRAERWIELAKKLEKDQPPRP